MVPVRSGRGLECAGRPRYGGWNGPYPYGAAPGRGALRVEQGFALLHWFRRLRIRWEIRDDTREAFLKLGCALICWRRVQTTKS